MDRKSEYIRIIEAMSPNLVLINVKDTQKELGLMYHVLLERKGRASLDIAFDAHKKKVVYINHIIQSEVIGCLETEPKLSMASIDDILPHEEITERNYHDFRKVELATVFYGSDLYIVLKELPLTDFGCFMMDNRNGLLFYHGGIAGILVKELDETEKTIILSAGASRRR